MYKLQFNGICGKVQSWIKEISIKDFSELNLTTIKLEMPYNSPQL